MSSSQPIACDVVLSGGTVIDGTGAPRRVADVAIRGDPIVAVGSLGNVDAAAVVDARGLVVAPGFIDVHTHDDRAVLLAPDLPAKVSQGVTSVVTGNCGISLAPSRVGNPSRHSISLARRRCSIRVSRDISAPCKIRRRP